VAAFTGNFLRLLLLLFEVAIIARVLLSYIEPRGRSAISAFVVAVTEPVLGPVRRLLPPTGAFDLSPLVVLLVIGAVINTLP
jgi:YggT family protein